MQKYKFQILNPESQREIVDLRQRNYRRSFPETGDFTKIQWNRTDSASIHLGALSANQLIACLRLSIVESAEAFKRLTTFELPKGHQPKFGILARAATDESFENSYLHSMLRLISFEIAQTLNLSSIWGTIELSSPRYKQLAELGYRTVNLSSGWTEGSVKSNSEVCLLCLENDNGFSQARRELKKRIESKSDFLSPVENFFPQLHLREYQIL